MVTATKFSGALITSQRFLVCCFNKYPLQALVYFIDLADLNGDVNGMLVMFTQVLDRFIIGLKAPDDLDRFACCDKFMQAPQEFEDIF